MKKYKISVILFLILLYTFVIASFPCFGKDFAHIEQLFDLRENITDQGKLLPEEIKKATGSDLRTLERIFELNTSALTTIEAYFRIVKIAIATGNISDVETVNILNEWLNFIHNQCGYDIEYLDAAFSETTDQTVIEQINVSKRNIEKLSRIASKGIDENNKILEMKKK